MSNNNQDQEQIPPNSENQQRQPRSRYTPLILSRNRLYQTQIPSPRDQQTPTRRSRYGGHQTPTQRPRYVSQFRHEQSVPYPESQQRQSSGQPVTRSLSSQIQAQSTGTEAHQTAVQTPAITGQLEQVQDQATSTEVHQAPVHRPRTRSQLGKIQAQGTSTEEHQTSIQTPAHSPVHSPVQTPPAADQLEQVQAQGASTEVHQTLVHRPRTRRQTRKAQEPSSESQQKQEPVLKKKQRQQSTGKAQAKQPYRRYHKKQLSLPNEFDYFKHITPTSFDVVDFLTTYKVNNVRDARRLLVRFVECIRDIHDRTKAHRALKRLAAYFAKSGYLFLGSTEASDYFNKKSK